MLPSGKNSNDVRSGDHGGHKNRLRCLIQGQRRGCDSPMVKVLDHGRHVMSSSPVPLSTRYVGQRCTLNRSRVETSSRWCGS
ncbi:hypothetical protein TNCV_3319881 [Trichonephila clavipes]|nr:hypothetical protein TNCV_3319881 [Trichonephila clavipes]